MKTLELKVIDPAGMHARPAQVVVSTAGKFTSDIEVEYEDKKVNLKSILGLMSLGIPTGVDIKIIIEGADEEAAAEALLAALKEQGVAA